MTGNNEMDYFANRNQTLNNNATLGKGYNYVSLNKEEMSTSLSLINSTIGLEKYNGMADSVTVWNNTNYDWEWDWIAYDPSNENKVVNEWNVLMFKIGENTKYLDTSKF